MRQGDKEEENQGEWKSLETWTTLELKFNGKNEGLAFSLARSNDGGFLEGGNITCLIFEYFTLCKAANCMTQAFIL